MFQRPAYICGPLTDLSVESQLSIKVFYSRLADACGVVMKIRAFAPHEHYDPVKFAHYTAEEVDAAERDQVCNKTSIVVAMYVGPSWGSGIEVEMARQSGVPVVILCPQGKKISRLLRGNPAVVEVIEYHNEEDALRKLKDWLRENINLYQPLSSCWDS